MTVFSTQQNRQLYVVTEKDAVENIRGLVKESGYPDVTNKGKIALLSILDHNAPAAGMTNGVPANGVTPFTPLAQAYEFMYVNVLGEVTHSDIIRRDSIRSMRYTKADRLKIKLPTYRIVFDNLTFVDGNGQSYTVSAGDGTVFSIRFTFPGFQNATDEEIFTASVAFKWDSGSIADAAAKAIAETFKGKYKNINKLVKVASSGTNIVEVWAPEGPWVKGLHSNKPTRIVVDTPKMEVFNPGLGLNSIPGDAAYRVKSAGTAKDVTGITTHTVSNYKSICDLEWFCMGERGDQYRLSSWPDHVETKYMADNIGATEADGFDVLDIHYYYRPDGVPGDASEKVITLVSPYVATTTENNTTVDSSPLAAIYSEISAGNAQDNGEPVGTDDVNEEGVETGTLTPNDPNDPFGPAVVVEETTPTYTQVTPDGTENPASWGWYEFVNNEYVLSTDTTVDQTKTYYIVG